MSELHPERRPLLRPAAVVAATPAAAAPAHAAPAGRIPAVAPAAWAVWAAPTGVGLALRLVAAAAGHGYFAVDDYFFGAAQGGAWIAQPDAPFTCSYRSPLLSRAVWLLMRAAAAAGCTDPAHRLQWAYAGLGVYGALAIPAVARLAAPLGPRAARQAAWLMAAYALLPRVATRALVESASMVPLVWGAVALLRATGSVGAPDGAGRAPRGPGERRGTLTAGVAAGLALGAAALLRFQTGVVAMAAGAWLAAATVWQWRRCSGGRPATAGSGPCAPPPAAWGLLGLALGGAVAAAAQAATDLALGRAPLSTPRAYVAFNLLHSSSFGTSAWHTYVVHLVLWTVPPATLWLAGPMWRALRRHALVAWLLVTFVAAHSLVGHKEDRFMFPVLPLFFVPLGAALAALMAGSRRQVGAARMFWGINVAALALTTLSDAHRNLTVPLLALARSEHPVRLAAVGFTWVPDYYAGPHAEVVPMPDWETLIRSLDAGMRPTHLLLRHPPDAAARARLDALPQLACGAAVPYPGDLVDRVLVRANRHNARRAATALLHCEPRGA